MRLMGGKRAARGGRGQRGRRRQLRLSPRGLRALAVLLAGGTLAGLWLSGLPQRLGQAVGEEAVALSASIGLRVEDVLVEGRTYSDGRELLAALGVERGTPILTVDPKAAKARLESLPWVREATVERRLPGILYLRLSEREPMALWQIEGRLSVIDQEGEAIPGADPRQWARLPLVVGKGAARRAASLAALIALDAELAKRVKAAVLVGERRWNVELDNGVSVHLPEEAPGAAWIELGRIVREEGLLERDVVVIDLRLPDRLILRTSKGEVPSPKPAGPKRAGQST